MSDDRTTHAGRLSFLTENDKARLYGAALRILAEIGMRVHHGEGRELLLAAGCTRDEDDGVHVPEELVERACASAPAAFELFDRLGEPACRVGGYAALFGTGADLTHVFDLETGERRRTSLADVGTGARLCDALDGIDFVMSSAYPHEVESRRAHVEQFRAMLLGTTKPLVMTAEGATDLERMWAAACVLRAGPDELRARPYFVVCDRPAGPLEYAADGVERLLFCADKGIPVVCSPATAAGAAALDTAAVRSAWASPESLQGYACAVEMARWLDLPDWGCGGAAGSQLPDAQMGLEVAGLTMLSMLLGSNLNHGVGSLDFGATGSLEQLVVADEVIAMDRRLFEGVEVDEQAPAGTVAGTGAGGEDEGRWGAVERLAAARWRPRVLNRANHERWAEAGAPDLREAARRRALELLETHRPAPLDAERKRRIDKIVDAFRLAA